MTYINRHPRIISSPHDQMAGLGFVQEAAAVVQLGMQLFGGKKKSFVAGDADFAAIPAYVPPVLQKVTPPATGAVSYNTQTMQTSSPYMTTLPSAYASAQPSNSLLPIALAVGGGALLLMLARR